MAKEIYVNGAFYPPDEAKVSVFDHGFLYGDGVFEGIRAYGGRVFKLGEHVERLYRSAGFLLLQMPITEPEMSEAILETCRRSGIQNGYIRVVVSRGAGDLGLDPRKCPRATVVVIADEISIYPEELYRQGLRAATAATRRNSRDALPPQVKSLNYLNNILAKIEANRMGLPEMIMRSPEGYVVEGTSDNIFIVTGGRLITPPVYLGALAGITRAAVMELAGEMGIPVEETPFGIYELYSAQECFLTGTAAEVIPLVEVDERKIGSGKPGEMTIGLIEAFRKLTATNGAAI